MITCLFSSSPYKIIISSIGRQYMCVLFEKPNIIINPNIHNQNWSNQYPRTCILGNLLIGKECLESALGENSLLVGVVCVI